MLALETRRLSKLFRKAADRTESAFYEMKPERWVCCGYLGSGTVVRDEDAWWVRAVDGASDWFETFLEGSQEVPPESRPKKWIRLKAGSEEEAREEARILGNRMDKEFFEKRKQAGVRFDRDAHYRNWTSSHSELRRAVTLLAKQKATTLDGLNMKAMVLAVAHDAFDDPDIWNEQLQKSISRDITRMAAA